MKKMNTKTKVAIALAGVFTSLAIFIATPLLLATYYGVSDLKALVPMMPPFVMVWMGVANLVTFIPIFFLGIKSLKPKGAVGESPHLVTNGVYQYLRNPLYSGVSFTLVGLGLVTFQTGLLASGLLWLLICYIQARREERELLVKYGDHYARYRDRTPRFVPRFEQMIKDGVNRLRRPYSLKTAFKAR